MAHDHGDHAATPSGGRLGGAAGLNVGFAVVQVAVGLAIGSVAVLADAVHQVVDAVGLVLALVAARLVQAGATSRSTYGLGRADALGALLSGSLLLASVGWIGWEAVERLGDPQEVAGLPVVAIGLVATSVNAGSLWLVGHHGAHLSLKAARLHLLTDLAGSLVVVVTGVVLAGTSWQWADPVASLLLCVAVLWSTTELLRRAVSELLDRTPVHLPVEAVERVVGATEGVQAVHHVHVRGLGAGRSSVTAHVEVSGRLPLHEAQGIVDRASATLRSELGVQHVTLQVECHACDEPAHAAIGAEPAGPFGALDG